jgi:signal peptidase
MAQAPTDKPAAASAVAPSRLAPGRLRSILEWVGIAVVIVGALLLRPPALGGSVSWVFITGSSMEPTMRTGDLVVVVPVDTYVVGDVIAFKPVVTLPGIIVHRIMSGDGQTGFVVQGDNNPRHDFNRPKASDMIGKVVLHVPMVGRLFEALKEPPVMGGLIILVVAYMGLPWLQKRRGGTGGGKSGKDAKAAGDAAGSPAGGGTPPTDGPAPTA